MNYCFYAHLLAVYVNRFLHFQRKMNAWQSLSNILSTYSPVGVIRRAKRKRSDSETNSEPQESVPSSPSKKKFRATSDYIYRTLFCLGEGSDMVVTTKLANGSSHTWRLHKIYLKQSRYFSSMLSGCWRESNENEVTIEVTDPVITEKAFSTAFESVYHDEFQLDKEHLVPILAAATMLQLDGLLERCVSEMEDSLQPGTVAAYHQAAQEYGQSQLRDKCVLWLQRHFTWAMEDHLATLDAELLEKVIGSPNLVVIHIEVDVYSILRKWLYLKVRPSADLAGKDLGQVSQAYFSERDPGGAAFLDTAEGQQYQGVFRQIRLMHIINDFRNVELLEKENIIPESWLAPMYKRNWLTMLTGGFDDTDFSEICCRFGRKLVSDVSITWRWVGFLYGVDLLISYNKKRRRLSIKRNSEYERATSSRSHPCLGTVCIRQRRPLLYRLCVTSLHGGGEGLAIQDTGVQVAELELNKDYDVMDLPHDLPF
eukprot:Colp12_sorted_trinity150504_noHs@1322